MPRHSRNRRYAWGNPSQYVPQMLPMPMGGTLFPFPMPPPLMMPAAMPLTPPPAAAPMASRSPLRQPTESSRESDLDRACLPHFGAERAAHAQHDLTDIVIIDFDRSLLVTPPLNMDLMDKDSRYVLESRLGPDSGWWQSPIVLDAALELGEWNSDLLEIARITAATPSALLVVTTYRPGELESLIRGALERQGVTRIDHFACSTNSRYTMGSRAKQQMLDVFLDAYPSAQRVFVYDASSPDRKAYDQTAFRRVKDGSFPAEAFRILNLVVPRIHFSPLSERELIEKLVEASSVSVMASVAVTTWRHVIELESRNALIEFITAAPQITEASHFMCKEIVILAGNLPPELRARVGEPGHRHHWKVGGYEAQGRTLYFFAVPHGPLPLAEPYRGNGARFEGARLLKHADVPFTPLDGPEFATFVNEGRELRLHEAKV